MAFALLLGLCSCSKSPSPTSPTGPSARTFYVATTGSDRSNGTINAPWLTLRYAVAQLRAGDALYLRGGIYTGPANTIDSELGTVRSGTSSSPITIAGYPSETVTIRPPGALQAIRLTTSAPAYLIFQDLIIDMANNATGGQGNGPDGIYMAGQANNNTLLHLEIMNNAANGIGMSTSFNKILNCLLHDNGLDSKAANSGYGIYGGGDDNLVEGNEVYNNHGYGIQFNSLGSVSRNVFRNNSIHDNFAWNVAGGIGGLSGGGLTIEGPRVGLVDANQVYDNQVYNNGQGGGGQTSGNGIQVYSNTTGTQVYNNTVYHNKGAGILVQYATSAVIRDNILYGNETDILDLGTGTILSNNHGP